jgi:hypothetical protein
VELSGLVPPFGVGVVVVAMGSGVWLANGNPCQVVPLFKDTPQVLLASWIGVVIVLVVLVILLLVEIDEQGVLVVMSLGCLKQSLVLSDIVADRL